MYVSEGWKEAFSVLEDRMAVGMGKQGHILNRDSLQWTLAMDSEKTPQGSPF